MKVIASLLVLLLVSGEPAFGQQAAQPTVQNPVAASTGEPPAPNILLDGTPLKLRLSENLTSATAKAGQQVAFEVLEEVHVQNVPVIAKGAQALGTITTAEPKKSMGRGGKLDVNIDSTRLIDGEKVALSATKNEKGGGHTGAMAVGMVGAAIVFFPAAPFLLFIHGKDITIPKGTEITAFVAGDMKLDMAKFAPQPAAGASVLAAAAIPAEPAMANLTVDSSVTGADIEIDGSFVGNTPSTVSVAPGQHTITVKKKGYSDWSRSMNVSGSSVHLSADLDVLPGVQ